MTLFVVGWEAFTTAKAQRVDVMMSVGVNMGDE